MGQELSFVVINPDYAACGFKYLRTYHRLDSSFQVKIQWVQMHMTMQSFKGIVFPRHLKCAIWDKNFWPS